MDLYCHACKDRKPMRMIRRPAGARPLGLLLLVAAACTVATHLFWPYGILALVAGIVLLGLGRNYWQCQACGGLTGRE